MLDFKMPGMDTPEGQGLLAAAFSLLQARKMPGDRGIGGALGAAGQQYMGTRSQAQDQMQRRKLLDAQMAAQQAEVEQRQAAIKRQAALDAEAARKAEEDRRIRGLVANAGSVRPGMGAGLPDGLLPPELSTGQTFPALQQPGQIDYQSLFKQGVPLEMLKGLAEAPNLGRPEVARTIKGMVNGREVEQPLDKFGSPVGVGMEQYKAPIMLDRGGQTDVLSPYTQPGASFPKTMTFGDRIAQGQLGVSQANLGLARQRLAFDQAGGAEGAKPQLVDGNWIYKPDAKNPNGRSVPVAGFERKPDATATKQLAGVQSLNSAIGEYISQLDKWGNWSVLSPSARAEMGTKYNHMMLQAKEAYNLGVLNGPDLDILTSVITDPRSYTGVITSKGALKKQAEELSRMMSKGVAPAVRGAGGGAEQGMPGSNLKYDDPAKESAYQAWVRRNKG